MTAFTELLQSTRPRKRACGSTHRLFYLSTPPLVGSAIFYSTANTFSYRSMF